MIELLKLFPLVALIVTHPLEQLSLTDYLEPEYPVVFLRGSQYIAPGDGVVKAITENDGFFQVTISLDTGNEIVYSGLTEVMRKKGDRILTGELIGVDDTISLETTVVLMIYEDSNLFPQFVKNDLIFHIDAGTILYMIADGTIIAHGFDSNEAGMYTQVKLSEKGTIVSYRHLSRHLQLNNTFLHQGYRIVASGNTGYSLSPRLALRFESEKLGDNIRVIYFRR